MVRTRTPWFIVAILFLAWAYGIYDGRFGESSEHVPEDLQQRTLSYLGRSLQLEEIAVDQTDLIKNTLFSSDREEILQQTLDALEPFENEGTLDETGTRALAVVREELGTPQEDLSHLDPVTRSILVEEPVPEKDADNLARRIAGPDGAWWDEQLGIRLTDYQTNGNISRALAEREKKSRALFDTNLLCAAGWWVLAAGGLFFLPHAIRTVRSGWTIASLHRPVRYGSRWEPSLVVGLLLAADLLAGFFLTGAYQAAADIETSFLFDVAMDSLWRVIAPAVALVILFRKPSHAIRSLGLNIRPDWRLILAAFAVISWANYGFNALTAPWADFDPTGGLDPMENGWSGLFYGMLSACVLAPIAEETFYRGILLRGLERRFGFWLSASVVTVAFMLAHSYDALGLVSVGMLGFMMVVIYRTTGSLTTVILLHALYNFTITLPSWLVYQAP